MKLVLSSSSPDADIGPTVVGGTAGYHTNLTTMADYPGLSAGAYTVYLEVATGQEGSSCGIDANSSYLMVNRYSN